MSKGEGHWDGDFGTGDDSNFPMSKNHQDHVYNGPSQHRITPHNRSADLGECSANELSDDADEYLKLIPDGKNRPHSP